MADSLGHSCIPTCRVPCLWLQPQPGLDPFVGQVAANMLQQSGSTYLQRGQDFVRSRMGFLSGSSMHYLFNVNGDYGELSSLLSETAPWQLPAHLLLPPVSGWMIAVQPAASAHKLHAAESA